MLIVQQLQIQMIWFLELLWIAARHPASRNMDHFLCRIGVLQYYLVESDFLFRSSDLGRRPSPDSVRTGSRIETKSQPRVILESAPANRLCALLSM